MKIFDVDGTLTHVYGEVTEVTGFHSYAFWDLLTDACVTSPQKVKAEISAWNASMLEEQDPTGSSERMMQNVLYQFRENVIAEDLRQYAKNITQTFIDAHVIRNDAISHLLSLLTVPNMIFQLSGLV